MGENILESQAKNTEKRRSRRAAEEKQGRLFQRGEQVIDEFTVDRTSGSASPKVGDVVHCFVGKGDSVVDVVFENQRIGTVGGGGGEILRDFAQGSGCKPATVTDVCELSDTVKVQVNQG